MESTVRRIEMGQERSRQNNDQIKNVVFAVSLKIYILDEIKR